MSHEKDIERLELKICNVYSRIDTVEGRVRGVETRQAVADVNIQHHEEKLDKIHNNTTWLLRLVIGLIVTGIFALLLGG